MVLFLSKLFGLYFMIMGAIILLRRKSIMPTITEIAKNKPLIFALGIIEIAAGLALALAYPVFSVSVEGALSLIGYMMVVEGIVYLVAPVRTVHKMIRWFNKPEWYAAGGILAIVGGAWLAGTGFGLI